MITFLAVEHYKSAENVELALGNLNILVGTNGSGKSNVLDSIRFIKDSLTYDLDRAVSDRHGIDSIRQWSPSRPYHVKLTIHTRTHLGSGMFSLTLGSAKGQYIIIREEGSWTVSRRVTQTEMDDITDATDDMSLLPFWFDDHSNEDNDDLKELLITYSYNREKENNVKIIQSVEHAHRGIIFSNKEFDIRADLEDDLFLSSRGTVFFPHYYSFNGLRESLIDFEAYSIFPNTLRTPQKPSNPKFLLSPS